MKVAIILFNIDLTNYNFDEYFTIGCDAGCLNAIKNNIKLDFAIGDFDSVNQKEFKLIESKTSQLIKLNPIKDQSDVEEALDLALKKSNDITIFGGIQGKRIEHFLSIISLFNKAPSLKVIDNNSLLFQICGSYKFKKKDFNQYKFISIFPFNDEIDLTLKGFAYELDNRKVTRNDCSLLISNQMRDNELEIISSKPILLIFSKFDNSNNIA